MSGPPTSVSGIFSAGWNEHLSREVREANSKSRD